MNASARDKLIWNAVPTLFSVPNPPKQLFINRTLPFKRERSVPPQEKAKKLKLEG